MVVVLRIFKGGITENKMGAKWREVIHSKDADKKQQNLVDGVLVCLQGQYSRKGSVHSPTGLFCEDS